MLQENNQFELIINTYKLFKSSLSLYSESIFNSKTLKYFAIINGETKKISQKIIFSNISSIIIVKDRNITFSNDIQNISELIVTISEEIKLNVSKITGLIIQSINLNFYFHQQEKKIFLLKSSKISFKKDFYLSKIFLNEEFILINLLIKYYLKSDLNDLCSNCINGQYKIPLNNLIFYFLMKYNNNYLPEHINKIINQRIIQINNKLFNKQFNCCLNCYLLYNNSFNKKIENSPYLFQSNLIIKPLPIQKIDNSN